MNSTGGALNFDMMLNDQNFQKQLRENERRVIGFTDRTVAETKRMDSAFSQLGRAAAGYFAFTELSQLPGKIVQVRGEFQQLEIAFRTMLGNQEKANKLMADVTRFAAVTPYGLKDTASATKQLLAYGESASTVTDTLRKLGDIASGIGAPLADIAYLYGTTMTQGRLYTQDLNQFTGRGIPMIKELAAIFKVAEKDVKGLVEAGKVGFPEVQQVIENLTKSGSIFGGLMEAQSKSLPGLQAQLGDAVDMMLNDIGRSNEGLAATVITSATTIVENYEDVIDVLKVVVATYGTYKAALMLTAAIQSSSLVITEAKAFIDLAKSIRTASDAQALFNLTTKANPYVLAASLLVGITAAFVVFSDKASEAEKAQESLNDAIAKSDEQINKEISNIEVLRRQITDENRSRDERNKKLKELIALNPSILSSISLENAATERSTVAINEYIRAKKEQIRVSAIQAQIDQNMNRISEISSGRADDEFGMSALARAGLMQAQAASGGTFKASDAIAKELKDRKTQEVKGLQDLNKGLLDQINNGIEQRRAARRKGSEGEKVEEAKTVAWYNQQIADLKKAQDEKSLNSADFKNYAKQIADLEKARDRITGGKVTKESASKIAQEENQIAVKSLEDQLEDKKKMYELYYRWVEYYGIESADKQFELLLSKNKSFVDYLRSEIAQIEKDKATPGIGIIGPEESYLVKLRSSLNELTGVDTPMQKFAKDMELARSSSESLTEEILKLKEIQSGLDVNDMSLDGLSKRQQLQERINEATKERSAQLKEFLVSVVGSEQKRLEIEKHYKNLRVALEEQYANDKGEVYRKALAEINAAEQKEYNEQKGLLAEQSKEFKALTKIIEDSSEDQTKVRVDAAKAQLAKILATYGEDSDKYRQHLKTLRGLEEEHRQKSIRTWASVGDSISQIGVILQELDGGLGEIGGALAGIGGGIGKLSSALSEYKKASSEGGGGVSSQGYVAAAQGVIQIIGGIVSASKQRKAAETEYYNSVLAFQSQYNQLLVEQIGLQEKSGSEIFVTDHMAIISNGLKMLTAAQVEYEASLERLEEGRAKTGQRNKVDWGKVGSMTVTGAAAGAAVGGWVGAIIGGAAGFVAGLFSKKKKETFGGLLEVYPELINQAGEFNKALAESLIANNMVDDATKILLQDTIAWTNQLKEAENQINGVITDLVGEMGDSIRNALVDAFKSGEDAAKAFSRVVGDVIADMVSQLVYTELFTPYFKELTRRMKESAGALGDGNFVDDIVDTYKAIGDDKVIDKYLALLQTIQDEGKKYGLDVFNKNNPKVNSMTGSIKGMSEETASQFIGQFNATRIIQVEGLQVNREQLIQLTLIASHTYHLISIDRKLDKLSKLDNLNGITLPRHSGITNF